jgi:hypothetical protein
MATKKIKPGAEAANDGELAVVAAPLPVGTPKAEVLWELVDDTCNGLCVTTIDSAMLYELAGVELVELQATYKRIEDQRFAITRPMDAAKKLIMDLFKSPLDRLDGRIKLLKGSMLTYDQEQKRKAAAQQAILDRIAADQRVQLAAEAQRQSDLAAAEHARAKELMQAGNTEGVADALNRAEEAHNTSLALQQTTGIVTAATAATNVPTVDGITTADVWKARVTDTAALLRFIADNPQYHDWIEFKMAGLNELAKAQRTELRIPGVEPFEESRIAAARIRKAA